MPDRKYCFSFKRMLLMNTAIAIVPACLNFAFHESQKPVDIFFVVVNALVYSNCIGAFATFTMFPLWPWLSRRPLRIRIPALFVAYTAITAVGCLFAVAILTAMGLYPQDRFVANYALAFRTALVITFLIGAAVSVYEELRGKLDDTTLQLRTNELERERALKLATEAQFSSLESRIHPHFLFNALNSISSLIREDPQHAERLIERMAALLRFSLDSSNSGLVTLAQEMKIVADYLEIEKARFGARLRYDIEIPQDYNGLEVPPLSIQTLVENSVKYAIAPRREGGLIRVRAVDAAGSIRLEVWDDGPGFTVDSMLAGHGLDNLQSRLLTQFGMDAALAVERHDGGTSVAVILPVQIAS
jgi:two-component system sensor histidine kinase AlgZ